MTVGGWKASIGRRDWDRRGSEQWGLSWLCEPPQGELCQIVNVNQISGKWGAGLFTAEEKKWRIYIEERGNSNMGFLLFAMAMWKSHATKGHVAWDLYPKVYFFTSSRVSPDNVTLSRLTYSVMAGTSGKLTSWKGNVRLVGCRLIGWQPRPTLSWSETLHDVLLSGSDIG